MVEVHTAAIVPPQGITVGHPAAFVAAAFGGMAAPMFVTISGWGMYRSASRRAEEGHTSDQWARWIIPRVALLCLCQLTVNVLLNVERGGRFEWHTPGVLTLLAISAAICPIFVRTSKFLRSLMMLTLCASPLILGGNAGQDLKLVRAGRCCECRGLVCQAALEWDIPSSALDVLRNTWHIAPRLHP